MVSQVGSGSVDSGNSQGTEAVHAVDAPSPERESHSVHFEGVCCLVEWGAAAKGGEEELACYREISCDFRAFGMIFSESSFLTRICLSKQCEAEALYMQIGKFQ